MPTDADLLRRYVSEKSEAAFTELVQRYFDLVYSSALRQLGGDVHRARDVSQVVFATLARKAAKLTAHPVLAGWLYTATQHAAAKAIRTEVRRQAREQEALLMQDSSTDDHRNVDWERVRPVLDEAMRQLPDRDREAVLLRFFARRPFGEIGTTLRLSEDAARMRVERALGKLQALLAQRDVTSTSAALATALTAQAVTAAPAGLATQVASTVGAGAGTLVTAEFLAFMTTTKIAGAVAATVILLAGGATWQQAGIARAATEATATIQRENAAQLQRLRTLEERASAAEQDLAQARQAQEAARAAASSPNATPRAGAVTTATPPTAVDTLAAGKAFLARFPEVKQALLDRSLARIRARYEPLYAALQLGPEQIRQLETILLDGEGLSISYVDLGDMDLRPGEGRSPAQMEQAVRALLGEDGYQRYRAASALVGLQQFTTGLAGALYFTDEPLTAQQARQLTPILAQYNVRMINGVPMRDWDGLYAAARPLLSAGQFAVLGRVRAQEEFGVAMKTQLLKKP